MVPRLRLLHVACFTILTLTLLPHISAQPQLQLQQESPESSPSQSSSPPSSHDYILAEYVDSVVPAAEQQQQHTQSMIQHTSEVSTQSTLDAAWFGFGKSKKNQQKNDEKKGKGKNKPPLPLFLPASSRTLKRGTHFGTKIPAAIPTPTSRRPPTPSSNGATTFSCTQEGRRRIGMCIQMLGAMISPNSKNHVRINEVAIMDSCENPTRSHLNTKEETQLCVNMRAHLFMVTDLKTLNQAIRDEDVHNICVKVLSTSVEGQTWLSRDDSEQCYQSGTNEHQNDGITGKRCLFFHGSGVSKLKYDDYNTQAGDYDGIFPSFPRYWSGLEDTVKISQECDARYYITDTTQRSWNNFTLTEEYCTAIARYQPHAIFVHSTGNNIIANGILIGLPGCDRIILQDDLRAGKIQRGHTLWFAVNPPFKGTPLGTKLHELCARIEQPNQKPTPKWYNGVCQRALASPYKGFATLNEDYINLASTSADSREERSTLQYNCDSNAILAHYDITENIRKECIDISELARLFVAGSMCGLAPDHYISEKLPHAKPLAKSSANFLNDDSIVVEWGVDARTRLSKEVQKGHDGFVPFSSCRVGNAMNAEKQKYGKTPNDAFYSTLTNHDDGRCAHGESLTNQAKQPCSWYKQRIQQTQQAFANLYRFESPGFGPRTTPLSPSFSGFRYSQKHFADSIHEQLDEMDERAKNPKATPAVGLLLKGPPLRKATSVKKKPSLSKPPSVAELNRRKKMEDDQAAQQHANLKAYEKARSVAV